jgi:dolichyl-phosphate beta-glucosyltransferase
MNLPQVHPLYSVSILAMPDTAPQLSIILPAYNAAEFLRSSLLLLREHRARWPPSEVIVVDDGSRDRTAEVAAEFAGDGVSCLRLSPNAGKGGAVRAGMLHAKGAYRIFMDADIPYELDAVDVMLRYLDVKEFDLVIGSRDLPGSRFVVHLSGPRRLASALFTAFVSRLTVTGVVDTQCGLKGFRAAAAERLFRLSVLNGFIFDVEILYLAFKLNLDVKRVPVRQVRNEPSTISLPWHSAKMLLDLLGIPLRYYRGGYDLQR